MWFVLSDTRVKPDTTLKLGQLITDPRSPQFSPADQPLSISPHEIIQGNPEENVKVDVDHKNSLKLGVGLIIAGFLKFGVDGNRLREGCSLYTIERVTTTAFTPDRDYV
jgi:hypothetical protein